MTEQKIKYPLTVREAKLEDIKLILDYWYNSEKTFLESMGVDLKKMPTRDSLEKILVEQLHMPVDNKRSYIIIWEMDEKPVGHCNTNPTNYGEDAFMHLHLWNNSLRRTGYGTILVQLSLPYFFNNLQLKTLYCQPYALNPAPHKTLENVGFNFVKEYTTTPGAFNFEQPVKLWEMTLEKFKQLTQ